MYNAEFAATISESVKASELKTDGEVSSERSPLLMSYDNRIKELLEENEHFKTELVARAKYAVRLEERNNELEKSLRLSALQQKMKNAETERVDHVEEIKEVKETLKTDNVEADTNSHLCFQRDQARTALKDQYEREITDLMNLNRKQERDVLQLTVSLSESKSALHALKRDKLKLERSLDKSEQQRHTDHLQLQNCTSKICSLEVELKALLKENQAVTRAVHEAKGDLVDVVAKANQEAATMAQNEKMLQLRIKDFKQQVDELTLKGDRSLAELFSVKTELNDTKSCLEESKLLLDREQAMSSSLQRKVLKLAEDLESASTIEEGLTSKLSTLIEEAKLKDKHIVHQQDELQEHIASRELDVETMKADYEKLVTCLTAQKAKGLDQLVKTYSDKAVQLDSILCERKLLTELKNSLMRNMEFRKVAENFEEQLNVARQSESEARLHQITEEERFLKQSLSLSSENKVLQVELSTIRTQLQKQVAETSSCRKQVADVESALRQTAGDLKSKDHLAMSLQETIEQLRTHLAESKQGARDNFKEQETKLRQCIQLIQEKENVIGEKAVEVDQLQANLTVTQKTQQHLERLLVEQLHL